MSHNVESMFSAGRVVPWHYELTKECTKIIQEAPTSADAIKYAGLDWIVEKQPIYDAAGKEISGFYANTRNSDKSVLGIVTDRYQIVQNHEAFNFTDNLISDGIMKYETAGSLRNGKQVWLLGKLDSVKILDDVVEPYICFSNTFDGSGAIRVCATPIRVVCNNTLNLALSTAKRSWSTKHVGDMNDKLREARETLGFTTKYMSELDIFADKLVNVNITDTEIEHVLDELFPVDVENDTQRKINNVQTMKDNFMVCYMMPDIAKFKGTAWGAIQAMSDMTTHMKPTRATETYKENNWGRIIGGHPVFDAFVAKMMNKVA